MVVFDTAVVDLTEELIGSRDNDAEPGQSGVDFVLLSLLASDSRSPWKNSHARGPNSIRAHTFPQSSCEYFVVFPDAGNRYELGLSA